MNKGEGITVSFYKSLRSEMALGASHMRETEEQEHSLRGGGGKISLD